MKALSGLRTAFFLLLQTGLICSAGFAQSDTSTPAGRWYINSGGERLTWRFENQNGVYQGMRLNEQGAIIERFDNISWNPATRTLEFRRNGAGFWQWYRGKIVEGVLGERHAAFTLQHGVQLQAQGVQVQHVRGGVGHLVGAQAGRAPVGRLLHLGQLHAQQLARHVLQAMAVRIGAGQLRGDLGAVDGCGHDPQMEFEHGDIKAAEVKKLQHGRIGQQGLQVRAVIARAVQAHHVRVALDLGEREARLILEDDGVGLRVEGITGKGFGLRGVMERLELVSGRLSVANAAGSGTRLTVTIPRGSHVAA